MIFRSFKTTNVRTALLVGFLTSSAMGACSMVDGSSAPSGPHEGTNSKGGKSGGTSLTQTGGAPTNSGGSVTGTGGSSGGNTSTGGGTTNNGGSTSSAGTTSVSNADFDVSIATWKGDAKGAYTIVHDDLCGSPTSLGNGKTAGLLKTHNLKAAFGAISNGCGEIPGRPSLWGAVKELANSGHEVINHSWNHTDHVKERNLSEQVDKATEALKANVGEQATKFYIFPFDSYDAVALDYIRAGGYLGARGGTKGLINAHDYPDDFRLNFDVYGPGYSSYCDNGVCATENLVCCGVDLAPCLAGKDATGQGSQSCRLFILNTYVDDAIAARGWAIREFHGVEDGWDAVPEDVYEQHLSYLQTKVTANELWVDTPTSIIKYRRSRDYCKPSLNGSTLSFGGPSADCTKYAVPLTLLIKPKKSASVTATQGGSSLEVKAAGTGTFAIQVNPTGGDVTLK